jgi:hypothetical protein
MSFIFIEKIIYLFVMLNIVSEVFIKYKKKNKINDRKIIFIFLKY